MGCVLSVSLCRRSLKPTKSLFSQVDPGYCASAGDENEVFVEVVRGLGETLVGNHPGAALAAVALKPALAVAAAGTGDAAPHASSFANGALRCALAPKHAAVKM